MRGGPGYFGPGDFDEILSLVLARSGAKAAALVVVVDGKARFSAQMVPGATAGIPEMLRTLADEIEADLRAKGIAS